MTTIAEFRGPKISFKSSGSFRSELLRPLVVFLDFLLAYGGLDVSENRKDVFSLNYWCFEFTSRNIDECHFDCANVALLARREEFLSIMCHLKPRLG